MSTPAARSANARAAALTRWGRLAPEERVQATAKARETMLARYEAEADPDGRLSPRERRAGALRLRRAAMLRLAAKRHGAR